MRFEILEQQPTDLSAYAKIPIAFVVSAIAVPLSTTAAGNPFSFAVAPVAVPYGKDYDRHPGNHPLNWAAQFSVSDWRFFAAFADGERAGGVALVPPAAARGVFDSRPDVAVLHDLRVAPAFRRQGIASRLLAVIEAVARTTGARVVKVETQNINVPACHLYAQRGFALTAVTPGAYSALPDEIQLIWEKDLLLSAAGSD